MSLFSNLTSDGLEENEDRLGGSGGRLETDVYAGKIKIAYAGVSQKGAKNVTLIVALANGNEYRETVYVTNAKGENFFYNKQDATKKVALPGFTTIDDICQVCTEKGLAEQNIEEKIVKIYDFDARQELPKSVPVLTDLIGKDVLLAIKKTLVNKNEKAADGSYVPTAESREENSIEKVFHPTLRVTVVEAKRGKLEPEFIDAWIEKNKGKTHDKRQIKDGEGGVQAGRPRPANAGPPQAGQTTARRSLFGNQAA